MRLGEIFHLRGVPRSRNGGKMIKNAPEHKNNDFSEVVLSRRRRLRVTGGPNPGCKDLVP